MYKYILFDLDGTLTDSAEGIMNSIKYSCEKLNLKVPSETVLKTFVGPPLIEQYMKVFGLSKSEAENAVTLYRERFAPIGIFENKVYPDVENMLKSLKEKGFILGVATSKPEIFAKKILEHFSLMPYFDYVSGSDLSGGKHDKTAVITEILEKMNADKEKTIMIGDRCFDIESAKLLGISSVAVTYGYGTVSELSDSKPDYMVSSPLEIPNVILKEA